ncbi:PH domain-containing protein [soil metagenome]
MAFPKRLLNEGEEVLLDLRPHWSFFAGAAGLLVLAVAALIAVSALTDGDVRTWLLWAMAAVVPVALARLVARYARWATSEFVVTTDRLVLRSGVLSKKGVEIPLDRVNTVFTSQRLLERLLRSGDLVIESGGERGRQVVRDVPGPDRVKSTISRAMEEDQRRGGWGGSNPAAPPPPVTEASVLDQLDRLDQLRQRGVISQAEFDTKKAQLLERL